jgi:hypothetical protein
MRALLDGESVTSHSISSLEDLRQHLQWAIELEHSTIPPYLCALYSVDPERNPDAHALLAGVLVEEMLHLALAANVLNAVGGRPLLDHPAMLPRYPRTLPHCDGSITLDLAPFDAAALDGFLRVEKPADPIAPAQFDSYETIGQFYTALEGGLLNLCSRLGERGVFVGDPQHQVTDVHFRYSAGAPVKVDSLSTALQALAEIIDQGEGVGRGLVWDGDKDVFHPGHSEVAHYYRFQELKAGRRYQCGDTPQTGPTGERAVLDFAAVVPMQRNPRLVDHAEGSPIRAAQDSFNNSYCSMLALLDQAFNGSPSRLDQAIGLMYELKAKAEALMKMPDGTGHMAGPSFDYVPPQSRT